MSIQSDARPFDYTQITKNYLALCLDGSGEITHIAFATPAVPEGHFIVTHVVGHPDEKPFVISTTRTGDVVCPDGTICPATLLWQGDSFCSSHSDEGISKIKNEIACGHTHLPIEQDCVSPIMKSLLVQAAAALWDHADSGKHLDAKNMELAQKLYTAAKS